MNRINPSNISLIPENSIATHSLMLPKFSFQATMKAIIAAAPPDMRKILGAAKGQIEKLKSEREQLKVQLNLLNSSGGGDTSEIEAELAKPKNELTSPATNALTEL